MQRGGQWVRYLNASVGGCPWDRLGKLYACSEADIAVHAPQSLVWPMQEADSVPPTTSAPGGSYWD